MAIRRTLRLKTREQRELEHYRDHDARTYVRERCSALLKIAAGVLSELQGATHWKAYSTVGYGLDKHDGIPTSMRLQYTTRGDQRNCDYWVSITSTHCNYGGVRLWFLCPGWKNGVSCGRRWRIGPHKSFGVACGPKQVVVAFDGHGIL